MQKKLFFLVALMLTMTLSVVAQVTTSSMTGKVSMEGSNEEIIGASVQAVHEPSGTRYTAVTNVNGRFTIQGMRTGGPYAVTVSYIGHQTKTTKGITLQLGETYNLNVSLSENANDLAEVVVSGHASKFAAEKTGASTNINNEQMMSMPMISRSITDIAKLSPYAGGGMSFAGANGKMSNFTVDGANFNNNFGLSDGLPGGGSPISLDAIEEVQVVIAPFDVRQTNFIGGGVNAITKSGTNTFKGTAYTYFRNEHMRGNKINGEDLGPRAEDRKNVYGFTLGGPIIKNKLFFFANYEREKTPGQVIKYRARQAGENPGGMVSRVLDSDMQQVHDYLLNNFGYETGSWTSFPADEKNEKLLARIDWNITEGHHLAIRYNQTKDESYSGASRSTGDYIYGGTGDYRVGEKAMIFANTMYGNERSVKSISAELNSRFGQKASNQLLYTYSYMKDPSRTSGSAQFPFIDISYPYDATASSPKIEPYISAGYELFTWKNHVENKVHTLTDNFTLYLGTHKVTAGFNLEHQFADNSYIREGTGQYRFRNLTEFLSGAAPEAVNFTYGFNGNDSPTSAVRFNQYGVYLQDEWNIVPNLKVSYGVRFDDLVFDEQDVERNTAIYALDFNGYHVDTGMWPDNHIQISPRVGFTWDVFGDKSLKVRGGTGIFTGRLPLVFFTNMPTNGGLVQYQAQINAKNASKMGFGMEEFAGGPMTNVSDMLAKLQSLGYPTTVKPEDGTVPSAVNGVDPSFKMPQVWKTSLAVDYQLPVEFPFTVSVEGIYNKTINAVSISDWSIKNVGGFARFNGVDNRPIFPDDFRSGTKAFVLENTSRGYGWSANITLNAQPADWVSLMAAYTHTVSKEVTGMPGSAAESAFTYVPTYEGPNNIKLHNSQYVTPDRIVASATLHDKCGNHYNFVYEAWRGGNSYSYMMQNDMNGDGYAYDALYIPTDEEVANNMFRFVSDDDKTRFMDYVHNDGYLSKHQGEYAEAYSVYSPWVHRLDFGYKHDFKLNIGKTKHMLQLTFDMKNVLNFFDSSWGVAKYLNPEIGSEAKILKYEGVDAQGFATFSTPKSINGNTQTWTTNYSLGQCWYASIGVKYYFN